MRLYLTAWSLAWGGAVAAALLRRRRLSLFTPGYVTLLAVPWKLVTFAVAAAGMMAVAPYTGDRRPGRGATFAFLEPGWPAAPTDSSFVGVLGIALPIIGLVAAMILAFVLAFLRG